MSLTAPTGLSLSQSGATVTATWNAVAGATYYLIQRYEQNATYNDRITVGTSATTSFTDPAVPIVVETGSGFSQAVWYYYVYSADSTGVYGGTGQPITMNQTTTSVVQGFDVSKPVLSDGTYYDYDSITHTLISSEPDQNDRDAVLIAYLKTIGA